MRATGQGALAVLGQSWWMKAHGHQVAAAKWDTPPQAAESALRGQSASTNAAAAKDPSSAACSSA